jgi:hypothetical protein
LLDDVSGEMALIADLWSCGKIAAKFKRPWTFIVVLW